MLCEPRKGDELEDIMRQFYEVIEKSKYGATNNDVTGALFLAVCRGKVSEGLDFADHNARLVITVRISSSSIRAL